MTIAMTDSEGIHRLAEGVYKNLIDGFNPCARQLIITGKAYFKALNGTAVAAKAYLEALSKLAENARQRKGATTEIGDALVQIAEVQKEIQSHQDDAVSEFYAHFLTPLENNLEQDGKTLALEQKKYLSAHKTLCEPVEKAQVTLRKYRKKTKTKPTGSEKISDKEQQMVCSLAQCEGKLDDFRREGFRLALLQERKRYCFVLDRLCAIIRSFRTYHTQAQTLYSYRLDEWTETSRDPETLPEASEQLIGGEPPKQELQMYGENQRDTSFELGSESETIISADSPDFSNLEHNGSIININSTYAGKKSILLKSQSEQMFKNPPATVKATKFQRSITLPPSNPGRPMVRAMYSYISSGDHQLSFTEGDVIALLGERNKGWQYGENLRSNRFGWFPVAYTMTFEDPEIPEHPNLVSCHQRTKSAADILDPIGKLGGPVREDKEWKNEVGSAQTLPKGRPQSMFGENVLNREHSVSQLLSSNRRMTSTLERTSPSSPPPPPPPVQNNLTFSYSPESSPHPPPPPPPPPPPAGYTTTIRIGGNKMKTGNVEINKDSSNSSLGNSMISTDSGFFNNDHPPPPPDYDDEDGHASWTIVGSAPRKTSSADLPVLY